MEIKIRRNIITTGWTIDVPSRALAMLIAEKIQDSDSLLFVKEVTMRYGNYSSITVAGDSRYENELESIVKNNSILWNH